MTQEKQQDKIQEIMGLVDAYYKSGAQEGLLLRSNIQSKLRELVREPLSDDAIDGFYENTGPLHGDYGGFHAGFRCAERAHNITSASGEV